MSNIILASGSPRRRELLTLAQLSFRTMSVDIDETPFSDELPTTYIERMVKDKSDAAIEQLNLQLAASAERADFSSLRTAIVLTADTIGVLADGKTVLVKPVDRAHAHSMWQQMSDSTHQVWTAVRAVKVQLINAGRNEARWQIIAEQQIMESTDVSFIPLTSAMMDSYWDSGEPADKAGGYAIQGLAAAWVTRINGSYTNVVGLPLAQTLAVIDQLQVS
ncbi:Maf family protein [Psychrobacter sp. 2Y5]|uniref:Maf family protein n=1 Tax=unclassified Psychrobacter TaxID=196806 RepID=UPI003F44D662